MEREKGCFEETERRVIIETPKKYTIGRISSSDLPNIRGEACDEDTEASIDVGGRRTRVEIRRQTVSSDITSKSMDEAAGRRRYHHGD